MTRKTSRHDSLIEYCKKMSVSDVKIIPSSSNLLKYAKMTDVPVMDPLQAVRLML